MLAGRQLACEALVEVSQLLGQRSAEPVMSLFVKYSLSRQAAKRLPQLLVGRVTKNETTQRPSQIEPPFPEQCLSLIHI